MEGGKTILSFWEFAQFSGAFAVSFREGKFLRTLKLQLICKFLADGSPGVLGT